MHDNSLPVGDRDDYEAPVRFTEEQWKKATEVTVEKTNTFLRKIALEAMCEIPSPVAVWTVADLNGWHEPSCSLETDLLLIHSEVSEACEALRKSNIHGDHGVGEELADVVIRVFHTAQKNNIDIVEEITKKHLKNMSRSHRHGGKNF